MPISKLHQQNILHLFNKKFLYVLDVLENTLKEEHKVTGESPPANSRDLYEQE